MPAKPKPTKGTSEKKIKLLLEKEIEKLSRELCRWRDGGVCVEAEIDGGRCSSVIQWGHYIPRQISPFLVLAVGNTFDQCSSHNNLHHHKDPTFGVWYASKFGADANKAIWQIQRLHTGTKGRQVWELEELREHYRYLLDNRPAVHDFATLCRLGYYGEWVK